MFTCVRLKYKKFTSCSLFDYFPRRNSNGGNKSVPKIVKPTSEIPGIRANIRYNLSALNWFKHFAIRTVII